MSPHFLKLSGVVLSAALFAACPGPPPDGWTDGGTDGGPIDDDGGSLPALGVQWGASALDEFLDVAADEAGVYVAGYRNGVAGTLEPEGDSDGIVLAYSHAAQPLWQTSYPLEGSTEVADALFLDGDSLLVAGRTSGSYGGFSNGGKMDLVVSRLHREGGTVTPLLQAGDERPQHPNRIVLDGRGEIVVAGLNDIYIPHNYVAAWEDTLIARVSYDSGTNSFALKSVVRGDTAQPDFIAGLAAWGNEGDVIVAGTSLGGSTPGPFAKRIRSDGEVVWSRRLGRFGFDVASAVAIGADGQVYVAGSTSELLGERAYGQQDAFVLVLDPDSGETRRAMQAGSSEGEWVRDVAIDVRGNLWVVGGTQGALPGFTSAGTQDAFIIRFDREGRWTGSWQHGTAGYDEANALALDPKSDPIIAGQTEGRFIEGATFGGMRDAFVLRVKRGLIQGP